MKEQLQNILKDQQTAHNRLMLESTDIILDISHAFVNCIQNNGKILLCGNGGSAADAQHIAAEFVGRFLKERNAWAAIALTTDSSALTAIGNDYGFDRIFSRQVEALAREGDIVVGISTSGRSPNVIKAIEMANNIGALTVGFTGGTGSDLPELCDLCFIAPSDATPRIQELHLSVWHAICDLVETELVNKKDSIRK